MTTPATAITADNEALGPVVRGILILAKYAPGKYAIHAEHDQVWYGGDALPVSDEDRAVLESLNWFLDEDSWSHFT